LFGQPLDASDMRALSRGRQPVIQVNVDATAMVQAGPGSGYAQQIIANEITYFLSPSESVPLSTVNLDVRIAFDPNMTTASGSA
jgi:ABC-2 type transport system permease protein